MSTTYLKSLLERCMQHLTKGVWLLILPIALVGCAYFNPYHRPTVPVTKTWSVKDRHIINTDAVNTPFMAWWRGFNDPTLNQLIERGLVTNNSLNMSKGRIEAAAGQLKKVRFQWIPTLDVLFGYSKNPVTNFGGVLAVLIPNYTMNIFYQIREQKQAKFKLAQIKAEDDAVKLTVISQIAASYFTYQAEVEREALLQILADDLVHYAGIAQKAYVGGIGTEIDPQELESEANLIRGQVEVIKRNIVVSRDAIQYLINRNPGELKTTLKFAELNNNQLIPGSLPLTVLGNRPDMQIAENRLRATNQGIGLAASNLLPTIQLDMYGGAASTDSRYAFPHSPVTFNDQLVRAPLVNMPVLGEIAKARGLNKESYFNYIDTLQKVLRDTTNALSSHDRLTNKLNQTIRAQQNLAKAYDLNYRLYHRGIQNYFNMLTSKIKLDRVNIKLNQDKLQQLVAIVKLYQELAGGYRVDEPKLCCVKRCVKRVV
jgi:multidrug efflux system outer membrane protein